MNEWIANNIYYITIIILSVPLFICFFITIFFTVDDLCQQYPNYRKFMYDGCEREETTIEMFFAKGFTMVGVVSIILPFIVIFAYTHYCEITYAEFWAQQIGRIK
jgi:hypothetical protein